MTRRLWILWLMLALLPLRGWAVATMQTPGAVDSAVPYQASAAAPEAQVRAPCHDGAHHDASSSGHACSLCDLCHSAAAAAPLFALPGALAPDAMPAPGAARRTGRQTVGGLERPPRPSFA